jgi:branched-chain amino acid aminotransferase
MFKPSPMVWMNGEFVPLEEAKISVWAHGVHYGDDIFEGLKVYKCIDGRSAIFRLSPHVRRLFFSASVIGLKIPFSIIEIEQAIINTIKKNNLQEGYIRPLVISGEGDIGPYPHNNAIHTVIGTGGWESYFNKETIRTKISRWRRDCRVMPFYAKVAANYVTAKLAKMEAEAFGADDAIVLDLHNYVVEMSAANIFVVKDKILMTPSKDQPILRGITRDSVIRLAQDMGIKVNGEAMINKTLLYNSDEVFSSGTAAEITPIKTVAEEDTEENKYEDITEVPIGAECPGPITKKLKEFFLKVVRGEIPEYAEWLTYV